jgi:HAD superfamily hydrolase (TIGR01549 family)
MLKAVMFDLDQTLIDSKDAHLAAMIDGLEREGWSTKIDWIYGQTAEEILRHSFPEMPEEILEKVVAHKKKVLKDYLTKIKVLPGAIELLKFLKSKDVKLILITNNSHREIKDILGAINLAGYFDDIVGKEDAEPKPSPHPLIKAIRDINPPLEETIYIGDSDTDIEAAKAAGVQLMINTQVHDTCKEKAKADWVVTNLKEALKIVKELVGK